MSYEYIISSDLIHLISEHSNFFYQPLLIFFTPKTLVTTLLLYFYVSDFFLIFRVHICDHAVFIFFSLHL